jgi:hypothetical protein
MFKTQKITFSFVSTVNLRSMKSPVGFRNLILVTSGQSNAGSAGNEFSAYLK